MASRPEGAESLRVFRAAALCIRIATTRTRHDGGADDALGAAARRAVSALVAAASEGFVRTPRSVTPLQSRCALPWPRCVRRTSISRCRPWRQPRYWRLPSSTRTRGRTCCSSRASKRRDTWTPSFLPLLSRRGQRSALAAWGPQRAQQPAQSPPCWSPSDDVAARASLWHERVCTSSSTLSWRRCAALC